MAPDINDAELDAHSIADDADTDSDTAGSAAGGPADADNEVGDASSPLEEVPAPRPPPPPDQPAPGAIDLDDPDFSLAPWDAADFVEEDFDKLPPELAASRRSELEDMRASLGAAAPSPADVGEEEPWEFRRLPAEALVPHQEEDPRRHSWCVEPPAAARPTKEQRYSARCAGRRWALYQRDPDRPAGWWVPPLAQDPTDQGIDAMTRAYQAWQRARQAESLGVAVVDLPSSQVQPPLPRQLFRLHERFPSLAPGWSASSRPSAPWWVVPEED